MDCDQAKLRYRTRGPRWSLWVLAWDARGTGTSDNVTDSGWKLFEAREEKARAVLDENSALTEKCPESYLIRQQIAQGQGIELETVLLKRAIAFDPSYYYYYRIHATLLLPKWYGEEGDASNFAAESADGVGNKKEDGDILRSQVDWFVPAMSLSSTACPGRACRKALPRQNRSTALR